MNEQFQAGALSGAVLEGLEQAIVQQRSAIAAGPITPSVHLDEIRRYLTSRYTFTNPQPLHEAVADVEWMLRNWQVQVTHPRYLGLFNPSVTAASVLADAVTALYNPQLAAWRTSPAANEIEAHTLRWLADKFGFPTGSHATFTSGGAEANLSAVVVALTRAFPRYSQHGLASLARAPRLYLSGEAHHSFHKVAHVTGLGRGALVPVAADSDHRMSVRELEVCVAEDRRRGFAPFLVVATAGTTGAGCIDPIPEVAAFCHREGLWMHVDAAWGGAAILSRSLRPHLEGIERADSITCDAHKWFSVPMGAGMFFCRHSHSVAEAFHAETSYMPQTAEGAPMDPYISSLQWSRRFIGLKLFLSLSEAGEAGYIEQIERQASLGRLFGQLLEDSGWDVVSRSPLPVVCFTRAGLNVPAFVAEVQSSQTAWVSAVRLRGGPPVIRACITSFLTEEGDVRRIVNELNERLPQSLKISAR